jgi:diguanylate cyclase (GGDEF)-like protein
MDAPEVSKGSYKRILGVLFNLTKLVNEGVPLNELLRAVSSASVDLVGADSCSIMLLDESRAELLCKAASGLSDAEEDGISFRVGEGIAGWVAERAAPALVPDAAADPRFKAVPGQALHIRSLLSVPLATREGVIGVMTVTSRRKEAFFRDHEELLMYLGTSIVKDIENARLYRLSITDSLTKAYNRQYLYQRLPDELERSRRYGDPLALLLLDVDHFKKLNDTWGHPAGDFILKELVRLVHQAVREVDGLVRYGGEEFLLILPKTTAAGAADVGERIRSAVEQASFLWSDQKLQVTVSVGASSVAGPSDTDEQLLKRADDALYEAKAGGRNRVKVG